MRRAGSFILALGAALCAAATAQQSPSSVALNAPPCVRVPEARAEAPPDEELGVGRSGEYCAYPLRMMAYHRIVNDHLGGPPILVTYDPDSGAGRVFDPVLEGRAYTFDVAPPQRGLPELKDRETGSVWSALTGEALAGPLAGQRMVLIPSLILTWERWKSLHPDSWVLSEDPKLRSHYTARITAASCPIPTALARQLPRRADARLKPDALVLGLANGGAATAFPLTAEGDRYPSHPEIVARSFGGRPVVLFSDPAARAAAAYQPVVKDRPLTFAVRGASGAPGWADRQTGSIWTIEGRCVEGALKGETLPPVDFVRIRWYAWSALHPGSQIVRSHS